MTEPTVKSILWSWNPIDIIPEPDYGVPNWFTIILVGLFLTLITLFIARQVENKDKDINKKKYATYWALGVLVLYIFTVGVWAGIETSRGITYFNYGGM